jgi:hypothetical protein
VLRGHGWGELRRYGWMTRRRDGEGSSRGGSERDLDNEEKEAKVDSELNLMEELLIFAD